MAEIQGVVRNFQQREHPSKIAHLVWSFNVEWEAGNGKYERRNVEMSSRHFLGVLWDGMDGVDVKLVDNGTDPIITDEVVILGKVNATVSTHLEKWQHTPEEPVEGEVLKFIERKEAIHGLAGSEGEPGWRPVWDLALGHGQPEVLVEFRSEKPWHGSISEGDLVRAYGTRSSGNVLLAALLEDESNHVKFRYERAFGLWWS